MFLFATPATALTTALGAVAGMLPDPLQFVYSVYPREPFKSLQRFHSWIHSKKKLRWQFGVISQATFAVSVSVSALALQSQLG
jgi:hypothetical protein